MENAAQCKRVPVRRPLSTWERYGATFLPGVRINWLYDRRMERERERWQISRIVTPGSNADMRNENPWLLPRAAQNSGLSCSVSSEPVIFM